MFQGNNIPPSSGLQRQTRSSQNYEKLCLNMHAYEHLSQILEHHIWYTVYDIIELRKALLCGSCLATAIEFINKCIWPPPRVHQHVSSCFCIPVDLFGERNSFDVNNSYLEPEILIIWVDLLKANWPFTARKFTLGLVSEGKLCWPSLFNHVQKKYCFFFISLARGWVLHYNYYIY